MSIIEAIIFGLIQGLTEFIPVSSSGHLAVAAEFTSLNGSFEFDVLLNIGTLLALIIFFRQKIINITKDVFTGKDLRLAMAVILSTVPAVLVGGLLIDFFKSDEVRSGGVVVTMLLSIGVLMVAVDRWSPKTSIKSLEKIPFVNALVIGIAQATALIPGSSRSGLTTLTGRVFGFSYKDAAEYSFLIAMPILFGAILRSLLEPESIEFISDNLGSVIVGCIVSFASGYLAIKFMIDYLKKHGLSIFGWYRIVVGLVLLLVLVNQ